MKIDDAELALLDQYFRAANYLSVGQIGCGSASGRPTTITSSPTGG